MEEHEAKNDCCFLITENLGRYRILLCKEKNDALVNITLPENSNIFASEYNLYLPDKRVLQRKLKEWIEEES